MLERPALASAFDQLYMGHERFGQAYMEGREAHKEVRAAASSPMMAEMQAADGGAPLPYGFPDDAARLATLMRNDPNIQLAFFALGGWGYACGAGGRHRAAGEPAGAAGTGLVRAGAAAGAFV
ncbi:hypothetical protein ACHMW6_28705 [Pseudoduganella sp. UC29_106]|uniref:hypothetical protein n=1 Tax=Pseudoduganella sp. UC29_106 TaxID=3374553 RepID=UPI003757BB92